MPHLFVEEKTFEKETFTEHPLPKGEYEYCTFTQCNFSHSTLAEIRFLECVFVGCNLSMVDISQTALQDIRFKDCKMVGLHFENCNHFGFAVTFENCQLNHSSLYRVGLKKTTFAHSQLHDVDFTESNLEAAVFTHCDLANATFDASNLEKADFRTSYNYSIDPEKNRIKKARFSLDGLVGLLEKYDIAIDMGA